MQKIEELTNHPFEQFDMPALLAERARTRANHPFIVWEPFSGEGRTWTYAKFAHDVDRLAAGLAARGVRAGDSLLVHLDNCPEIILAWFASAKLGSICVTTNARSAADEMTYFADHSGAVAGITQPKFADLLSGACRDLNWLAVTETDNGEAPAQGSAPGSDSFEALFGEPADAPVRAADPLAPLSVQFTSGTTSRPKAVLWNHANGLWGARMCALHEDLRDTDVHLIHLPLFHTNALNYSLLATLWAGGTAVVLPRFSGSRFWDVSVRHGCTWTSVVPFCSRALLDHAVPAEHQYRLWGNAFCSPPDDETFRVKTIGWWGMTETITMGIVGSPHLENREMSVGRPSPAYQIAVVDDDGRKAEAGGTGNLKIKGVRGLSMFVEYLGNAEATAASMDEDGWFLTGDKIAVHEDGFLTFSDRAKDMLKVGGENVAASEVERVIMEVPLAREVAVVGRPDRMLDEVPVAFVLVDGGVANAPPDYAEQVLAACRTSLADFKVPREVKLVDEFPRSTIEKIAKNELRASLESS